MGNQNCRQVYQQVKQNQAYGDFQLIRQNNRSLALIQKSIQQCSQVQSEIEEKLQLRSGLKSPHLIKLIRYQILQNQKSTVQVKMLYQYQQKTLQHRMNEIFITGQDFTQRQIFNIVYGVQSALEELDKHAIRHGCLNLTTIFVANSFYKITDVSSTTFVKSYDLVKRGFKNQFLSQKLLTNLQYRSLEPFYQLEDDLFSLGIIVLLIVQKKTDSNHFYQWKDKKNVAQIKWKQIEAAIKKLQRNYSSKLSKRVKMLIRYQGQQQKSLQTNFTMNNLNIHSQHFNSINEEVNELDKDIEKILSRVQNNSRPKQN